MEDSSLNKKRIVDSLNPDVVFNISIGAKSIQIEEGKVNTEGISGAENFNPATPRKKEGKIYTKYTPSSLLSDVRGLLATGLLEGLRVKYKKDELMVSGIIQDLGYKCGCSSCNYTRVVSALEFEKHARATSKNQNNHIFLESGKSLYALVKDLGNVPLGSLGDLIEEKIRCPANMKLFKDWKDSYQTTSHSVPLTRVNDDEIQLNQQKCPGKLQSLGTRVNGQEIQLDQPKRLGKLQSLETRVNGEEIQLNQPKHAGTLQSLETKVNGEEIQLNQPKRAGKLQLLKRLPPSPWLRELAVNPAQQKTAAQGGQKKRDPVLHRGIFMENGLPDGVDLAYCVKGEKVLGGYKLGNGIFCNHCQQEVSPSVFEMHAGHAAKRQPYRHIYTSNGLSLHEVSLSLSKGDSFAAIFGLDICEICGNGGDLFHCGGCPNAYHAGCLDLECNPDDEWYCSNCKENFMSGTATDTMPSNAIKSVNLRLKRIIDSEKDELGHCKLCKDNYFLAGDFNPKTIIFCKQCWMEYHAGCLKDHGLCDLKEFPGENWLCSKECAEISAALQTVVHDGPKILPDSLLSLLSRKTEERGLTIEAESVVQWQLLSGNNFSHSLSLFNASAIFQDAFEPIVVRGYDIKPALVFGRNMASQFFGGMYCVVLTIKSVIVSTGVLRVFDRNLAELPLVATSSEYQRKGYFRVLLSIIEMLLSWLKVKFLVVPCGVDEQSMWMTKLGFRKVTAEQLQAYQSHMVAFQETMILGKAVPSAWTDGS